MSEAYVVVGMSVREVDDRASMVELARAVGGSHAFLQQGDPSLTSELTRLADAGHGTITLVGVSTGLLPPGASWLGRAAAYWWRQQPDPRPVVRIGAQVTSYDEALVRDSFARALPVTGREPGLTSEAWEQVSGHRRQVLLCRGPRCTAKGAEDSVRSLVVAMLEEGLGDDDALLVHTGCQFPCNQSPVVSVQPDDVWYGHVDPEAAARIVREHLVDGVPVESHRLPRSR